MFLRVLKQFPRRIARIERRKSSRTRCGGRPSATLVRPEFVAWGEGHVNDSTKVTPSRNGLCPSDGASGERRDKPACCRGCKSPTGKESSESILASSLAGRIARCGLKRRQGHRWAGLLRFEKPLIQDADSIPRGGRQYDGHVNASGLFGPA